MKTIRLVKSLAVLLASVSLSFAGPQPVVVPPQGGQMSTKPVGGQMAPTAVGGSANAAYTPQAVSPNGLLEPLPPLGGGFNYGPPGGAIYLSPFGYYPNPAVFGAPGGMLNGGGVANLKSSKIVPGATNAPGAALNPNGVGGTYKSGVIVAGGTVNPPGGTFNGPPAGGTGGVIVTGGGGTASSPSNTQTQPTTGSSSGGGVIVTGGSSQ